MGGLHPNHRCWSEKLVFTVMGSIFTKWEMLDNVH